MKNNNSNYQKLEFKLIDFIPILGIIPAIKRNGNKETNKLNKYDLQKTLIYAFYQTGTGIVIANYLTKGLENIF